MAYDRQADSARAHAIGGGPDRVLRGGSWNNDSTNARAAYRNHNQPDNLNDNIGFRVALAAHDSAAPAGKPARTPCGAPAGGAS